MKIPRLSGGSYQSGSYSIRTTRDVSGIWMLFVKLLLEDYPDMFDGIELRRVGRVFIDLNVMLIKLFSNNRCSMHWSIILLKYSVADGAVNALRDRKDKVPPAT